MKRVIAMMAMVAIATVGFAQDYIYLPLHLTFTPGLPPVSNVNTSLGVGIIMNDANEIHGAQVSSVLNFVNRDMFGIQAAGVGNLVGGGVDGLQTAGVFNLTQGEVSGYQYAGVFNIVEDDARWVQAAGVFNIVEGDVGWLQTAGVFNIVDGNVDGFQSAGVFNIVDGDVDGVQTAGVFNVADDVRGAQFGVVNVGGRVRGLQVGVVNIARRVDGFSLGLVNIIEEGIFDLLYWTEMGTWSYFGLQQGGRNWYTLAYAGTRNDDYLVTAIDLNGGLGLGYRFKMDPFHIDADVSARSDAPDIQTEADWENEATWETWRVFPSARVSLALDFGHFAINAGMVYDAAFPDGYGKAAFHGDNPVTSFELEGHTIDLYQKWFVGLKL